MTGGPPSLDSVAEQVNADTGDRSLIILATNRRWLRTALEEVLAPEGFDLIQSSDADELVHVAGERPPAVVIVDEELPGLTVQSTARALLEGPIGRDTPLLLYTASSLARGEEHADAYRAGFWDLLSEPLRPGVFVAKLRRLLFMSEEMRGLGSSGRPGPDSESSGVGFLSIDELGRVLPAIGALAEREQASVSIVLLSPTPALDGPAQKKSAAASLCGPNLRRADLCAWIDDAEIAVVAFDTQAQEARSLVERLTRAAADQFGLEDAERPLSAAIVELEPSGELSRAVRTAGRREARESVSLAQIVELFHLKDARDALRDAREAGGGVRVIEVA